MGWDDNGLPTERRVQNYYGVRCDPSLPYDPDFTPPGRARPKTRRGPISRRNFIELCERLTVEDEKAFEDLWRHLGLSVDWSQTYTTIDELSQRVSQRAFLRNLARGEAYRPRRRRCGTSTSDRGRPGRARGPRAPGAYHRLAFHRPTAATDLDRDHPPRAAPACVALVAHPDDERYQPLFGTTVTHAAVRRRGARSSPTSWPSPTRAPASP
jgi:valyl-tRNA synthetase